MTGRHTFGERQTVDQETAYQAERQLVSLVVMLLNKGNRRPDKQQFVKDIADVVSTHLWQQRALIEYH